MADSDKKRPLFKVWYKHQDHQKSGNGNNHLTVAVTNHEITDGFYSTAIEKTKCSFQITGTALFIPQQKGLEQLSFPTFGLKDC